MKHTAATAILSAALLLSVAGNAVLVARIFSSPSASRRSAAPAAHAPAAAWNPRASAPSPPDQTDRVAAPRATWSDVQSADLHAVAATLRAAGFAESLVRAAVTALVDESLAARRSEIGGVAAFGEWMQRFPVIDGSITQRENLRQLARERREILTGVLGSDPSLDDDIAYRRRELSFLPESKIAEAFRIENDYSELERQIREDGNLVRLPEDAEKLTLLAREKRADLAALLTPEELDLYEMYRSPSANSVRARLAYFDASEQEFRTMFAVQRELDEMSAAADRTRPEFGRQRAEAEREYNQRLKAALGEQRHAELMRSSSSSYRAAVRVTDQLNLPRANAAAVYDLQQSATRRRTEIMANIPRESSHQRAEAARQLIQEVNATIVPLLTPAGLETYKSGAGSWLRNLERDVENHEKVAREQTAPRP